MRQNTATHSCCYHVFKIIVLLLIGYSMPGSLLAQEKVIRLYEGVAPGSENWDWKEAEAFNKFPLNAPIVYNITTPTLTVFKPTSSANGTAVIVCPGGAFHVVNMEKEGYRIAKALAAKGITAFVFKYRTVKVNTDDPWKEMGQSMKDTFNFVRKIANAKAMARADLLVGLQYVKTNAASLGIDSKKIGLLGFSAGAGLVANLAYNYTPELRPDFVAPIYTVITGIERKVKEDAPPLFLAAATDDSLALVSNSIDMYNDWKNARKQVEMHVYSRGGHGLSGNHAQTWFDRFIDWLINLGIMKPNP